MVKLTLDAALQKAGITRYEPAKRTGIHFQIVDNYDKNKVTRYDSYLLNKMCTALSCSISDLISYQKD